MKLVLDENILHIKLNLLEMFFSMHSSLKVPVEHITSVSTDKPGWTFSRIVLTMSQNREWVEKIIRVIS